MIIKFWGAAKTVTGSMHLLQLDNGKKILLECGIYQGNEGFAKDINRSFPCEPSEIDCLILSHAHIDHCGNIPQLVKSGFRGPVYATHATYDLASILLQDSAYIQEKDAEHDNKWRLKKGLDPIKPLYDKSDVIPALSRFITIPYELKYEVMPGVELVFLDAGHMLGSATVNLMITEGDKTIRLGFTGDVGRPGRKILRDPVPMLEADYLISESTYGGKDHETISESKEMLREIMYDTCVKKKGKLIIPAFSVGRTQEIVHAFDQLENEGKLPKIPIYVDSPLAVNATDIFKMHPECFNDKLMDYILHDPNPFGFNRLHYVRSVQESKALNVKKGPAVIISASGMMTAGRILHHLRHNISDNNNTILVVGYCANGTLGSRLVNGEKNVKIYGEEYKVKASILRLNSFSAHAGQTELYDFITSSQNLKKMKKIFLVHGETDRSEKFQNFLAEKGYDDAVVPNRGESFKI